MFKITKLQTTEVKIDARDYVRLSLCTVKQSNRIESQAVKQKKMLAKYITDKGLIGRIYKKSKPSKIKANSSVKKWTKGMHSKFSDIKYKLSHMGKVHAHYH